MKGLLIKDLRLLMGQKKFLIVVVLMGIFLMSTGENISGALGYIIMIMTILTLSTISYDEFDNGMAFLMTLPITRKQYVQEKYLLGVGVSIASCLITVISACAIMEARGAVYDKAEIVGVSVVLTALSWSILAMTLPMQIKYGAEKGRVAMLVAMGGIFGVVFVLAKIVSGLDLDTHHVEAFFEKVTPETLVVMTVAAMLLVLLASYLFAVKLIYKKEY